jgi:hypothetical protein
MVLLKGGRTTDDPRLDRVPSATTEHIDRYPLTLATAPTKDTSMVMGVNWYGNFDEPEQRRINGRTYWVIGDGDLGKMRGGHSTCLRNWNITDPASWYRFYDQGEEGRCVEFATLRERSHANRVKYDITSKWHYFQMQYLDEWPGGSYPGATPIYEGTSVRAAGEYMLHQGPIRARALGRPVTYEDAPRLVRPEDGINTYRWATSWDDVRAVLRVPSWYPGVPLVNSWGTSYPHEVILLDAAGERLLSEDGEFSVVTDK